MRRFAVLTGVLATLVGMSARPAGATPVCAGLGTDGCPQASPWGPGGPGTNRIFMEPSDSTNWTQFGPDSTGRAEFADGTAAVAKRYPKYVKLTTLADILHDPSMVSIGVDGKPPWDPADKKDGLPQYVVEVTDFSVPDKDKAYVFITAVHSAEPCGREAGVRMPEDLAILAGKDASIDNGTGVTKGTTSIKVAELLKKEKIFFVWNSPDGWRSGDQDVQHAADEQSSTDRPPAQSQYGGIKFTYSEENGRGVNTNRQAPTVGWMFRQPKPYPEPGQNPILTEPEGIGTYRFVKQLIAEHGGPIDGSMDIHGGVPAAADIMLPDGQFDPHQAELLLDMAQRVKSEMDSSVGTHFSDPTAVNDFEAAMGAPNQWSIVGNVWDTINYTVTGATGFWLPQLGSIGTNYENNCLPGANSDWNAAYQVFVDSARAAMYTTFVQSVAQRDIKTSLDTKGQVGYVMNPDVVTDADGNPSPPPTDFPNNPAFPHGFTQTPYRATSMNFVRDVSKYATTPFAKVGAADVPAPHGLDGLDTLVLVNHALPKDTKGREVAKAQYYDRLRSFVQTGGNLVVTDGAADAIADMGLVPQDSVKKGIAYVGYVDIQQHDDDLVKGLPAASRQTYDPITLGYQLRIERDGHWSGQPESGTANQAPIWTISRAAWEAAGGRTVATSDPLNDPKTTSAEGTATDKVSVGTMKVGQGRIVFVGALLPDPTEANPHWFGLGSYGVTFTGYHIFDSAIAWTNAQRPPVTSTPKKPVTSRRCLSRRTFVIRVGKPKRGKIVAAAIRVNGKRVKVGRVHGRFVARVDLRKLKAGRYTVKIRTRTKAGGHFTTTRHFRTCARKKKKH